MIKRLIIFFICYLTLQANAFEDLILSSNEKMTDIKIENNQIINIHYLTTILNEKDTIFINPINIGETSFSLIKANEKYTFNVKVDEDETFINNIEGFEIVSLDTPPQILDFEIDPPPVLKKEKETINIDGATIEVDNEEGE